MFGQGEEQMHEWGMNERAGERGEGHVLGFIGLKCHYSGDGPDRA